MSEIDTMKQDLEMMIQKRNRCEDWVASVALRKQNYKTVNDSKTKYSDDCEDEYSEISCSNESTERRCRKKVDHQKLSLSLSCEWRDCTFAATNARSTFINHVKFHLENVAIIKKPNESEAYQCLWDDCNFDSVNISEMRRHITYHSFHAILKAAAAELHTLWEITPCRLDSDNRNMLPDLAHPFECGVVECDFVTDYFNVYLDHVNVHIKELDFDTKNGREIKCIWKGCNTFKCRKRPRMKLHIRTHTGEKILACPTCGAFFSTNTKYMDHCTRKIIVRDESNRCQYCLRYYSNERLLRDHMRYHINSHKCSFCEMTCSTPAVLANHVRYRHLNEAPYKCKDCSFKSVKAEDHKTHMCSHAIKPRFECNIEGCSFSCRAEMTFKKHFRMTHLMEEENSYCCHLCDKKYNRGSLLGNHLLVVHKLERPPGHSRFRYMKGIDGNFRLQVERYESLELNNADAQISSVDASKGNLVLKQEVANEKTCEKFTVFFDENEDNAGALIAIEELDEKGRIIRTSTVREEMISVPTSNDIVFVDVNAQSPGENVTRDSRINDWLEMNEKKKELAPSENYSVTSRTTNAEFTSDSVAINSDANVSKVKDSFAGKIVVVKRKQKTPANNFSDSDCFSNDIRITYNE